MRPFLPLLFLLLWVPAARGEETHASFHLEEEEERRGNLLDLVFGSVPPMPTERGILIIDAFDDGNGNGLRDAGERDLAEEIVCQVDDIRYTVPAFIPGLAHAGSYTVACAGDRYRPAVEHDSVFVRRRGEIIELDLPCSPSRPAPAAQPAGTSHQPSKRGK